MSGVIKHVSPCNITYIGYTQIYSEYKTHKFLDLLSQTVDLAFV